MFRYAALALLFCAIPAAQPPADPPDKDVYTIYSQLLTNPQTSHGNSGSNPILLIRDTTVPGTPREPCVRPPKEREPEFREVLADFEARKDKPRKLEPAFTIPKPYRLLNESQAKEFIYSRGIRPPGTESKPDPYPGVTDLFSLTDVYFNRNRTLALTAIATWCGGLCGLMQWKVLEKSAAGKWKELPWVGCSTIAQTAQPAIPRAI